MSGKIKFTNTGPAGKIHYTEGFLKKNSCEFYWGFSGGDTVATVWFPSADKWGAKYPWAAGRHKEILETVAAQTRKEMARSATIKWEADRFHLVKSSPRIITTSIPPHRNRPQ